MKICRVILWLALLLGLASCHSSKKTARVPYADDIYANVQMGGNASETTPIDRLLAEAYSWKGTPYKSGGHSRKGTDCSGYTMEVYRTALGVELPRNSAKQFDACDKVKKSKIQPGDLLFFHPSKKGKISHVGIYVGDNKMLHASSSGVMESDITLPYWEKCYHNAGRVKMKDVSITNTSISQSSAPAKDTSAQTTSPKATSAPPKDAVTSPDWSF